MTSEPITPPPRRNRKITGRLTDLQVRSLETPLLRPKKHRDGNNLYLIIFPTGLRSWRYDYTFLGKQKTLDLGPYPVTTLAEARAARDEAKRMLRDSVDPNEVKKAKKQALRRAHENSFESAFLAWWEWWAPDHHQRYTQDVLNRFKRDVLPIIGGKPITQIEAVDLVRVMKSIEKRGAADVAKRSLITCRQVLEYARNQGFIRDNPALGIKPSGVVRPHKTKHHARVPIEELPMLLRKIEAYQGSAVTRIAMRLLALTFVRTSELIGAKWSEINFEKAEWRIPAERMKVKTEHIVPLAPEAVTALRVLQTISGLREHLFPGDRDPRRPMSNNTILKALERMGYKGQMTGHGFRGLAATYLYEQQYPAEVIEPQLAHLKRNKVSAAYDWSKLLPQRRAMMEAWAKVASNQINGSRP